MQNAQIFSLIEQAIYVVILLFSLSGVVMSYKRYKTVAGTDLLLLGFLLFAGYALLAIVLPGFAGSYFHDLTMVGTLSSQTSMHFLSIVFKLGLVFVMIGLYRIGRKSGNQP